MLLKYSQYQRRNKLGANGKPHRGSVTGSRIPNKGKAYRKGKIVSSKRLNGYRNYVAKREEEETNSMTSDDPICDNSNDSGLGFDQVDYQPQNSVSYTNLYWNEESRTNKRPRIDIKLESDNANDNFTFPQIVTVQQQPHRLFIDKVRRTGIQPKGKIGGGKINGGKVGRSVGKRGCVDANNGSIVKSRDGSICLEIISQPENQHRARYQTEGSRGAVKDTTGNSFPLVKLSGYGGIEPALLQVYIGTDQGKVAPHMFYQACKVSGKNSTPCSEKKLDGTVVIEIEFDPSKDNLILCDCVGILKERNVDVEHRFPDEATARSRKKSTRCRMVFKTILKLPSGLTEILQVTSHPIACTQPPGIPEICKKSLSSCPVNGNTELFIIGKNFLKDTKVKFSEGDPTAQGYWECIVQPDKEYLHQSHLVCNIPQYRCDDIKEPVHINVSIYSGGKSSEPVYFSYTPVGTFPSQHCDIGTPSSPVPAASTSFFAVTQNLGPTSQAILQGVPKGNSFTTPQKILIIPSTMDLSNSSPSLCSDDQGVLKSDGGIWLKEKLGMVPVSLPVQVPVSLPVQVPVSLPVQVPVSLPVQVPVPIPVQVPVTLPVPVASQNQTATHMVPSATAQQSIILGVNPVSGIVQSTSPSSSPPSLLQEPTIAQPPPIIGVGQPSTLLQVSDIVHAGNVLQASPPPAALQSPPRVLHSPELSPVGMPTSPVLQNSAGTNSLEQSPVMETLSQASSLQCMQSLSPQSNLVHSPTLSSSDLIPNQSSGLVDASSIVPNLNHAHIIESGSQMIQTASVLVKSPSQVLSHHSPSADISSSHSPTVLKASSLNPTNILTDQRLSSPVLPVATIAEAATILQNTSLMEANGMVQNTLVNTVGILGPTISENTIELGSSSGILGSVINESTIGTPNLVQTTGMMQEGSFNTSLARGIESATPGGAANAVADLSSGQLPSLATIEKFVSGTPLPSLSVETYLSHIENKPKVDLQQNLMPPFPNPPQQESPPIAIKQMVVAAAAAALKSKPAEPSITYPGKTMDTINHDVIHHNPVLLATAENQVSPTHLNYQNQEFLPPQQTNFQIIERSEPNGQTFAPSRFPTDQMFEPTPLFSAPPAQEKLEVSEPPPTASRFPSTTDIFVPAPLFNTPIAQEKLEAPPKPPSNSTGFSAAKNMFESGQLYPASSPSEKMDAPKPAPPASRFPAASSMFESAPLYPTPSTQEKLEAPKPLPPSAQGPKKCEEGIPVPHELTVMSENDLISYINPSCFDQV